MSRDKQSKGQIVLHSLMVIVFVGSIAAQVVGTYNVASNRYDTAITPPSAAFQIWTIIYLLTTVLIIWQFFTNLYGSNKLDYAFTILLMSAFVLGAVWMYLFGLDNTRPQFFLILFYSLLITATSLLARYCHVHPFVRIVVDTHTSWILFATILSGFCYVKYSFWMSPDSPDSSPLVDRLHEADYSLILMFAVLLQGCLSIICASFSFGLVSVWACSWITARLFGTQASADMPSLRFSAGSGILISIGMTVLGGFLFDNNIHEQRDQSTNAESTENTTSDKVTNKTNSPSTYKLVSKDIDQANPTPVIIETPSIPNSELSVLA
ncbi:Hypothetical protein GLP15_4565 [Giardia lamblia P15]|uniref:Uncharacterized protein n=1 Tax=Giardia intestinalis (strain P15) TaxID=658858 RepID=E1F100_GIAIA|nr:Hypothetical protein GLP15_4565 [Giardia lamblia P15]